MMKLTRDLARPLAASGLTSALMIVDRIVMNFIPLIFWGVELAAYWVFLRAWLFLLMSFEGGIGGRAANEVAILNTSTSEYYSIKTLVKKYLFRQLYWGSSVFVINAIVVWLIFIYQPFEVKSSEALILILIGIYSAFYYVTQLVVYSNRGIGQIYQGQMFANTVKIIEIAILIITPMIGIGILGCVVVITIIRGFAAVLGMLSLLPKITNPKEAEEVTRKVAESLPTNKKKSSMLGYILYPLFPALNNFLPLLFLSSVLSPLLILQFSISRLFGRVLLQLSQVLSRVLWPFLRSKNNPEDFISSFKKILNSYLSVSSLAFLIIIAVSFFLNDVEFKDIKLSSTVLIIYTFLAFIMGLIEVFLSMLIAKEKHANILFFRIMLCLTIPVYVWLAGTNTSLEWLGITMILAEFIALVMCYRAWLEIIKAQYADKHDET
jgi:hypothetical protein